MIINVVVCCIISDDRSDDCREPEPESDLHDTYIDQLQQQSSAVVAKVASGNAIRVN
jgi:hypothetical protein